MSVFTDFWGSITVGKYYYNVLTYPAKNGWRLYIFLIILMAVALSVYWGIKINTVTNEVIAFYLDINREVVFENGEIANMPYTHKEFHFKELTIHVDRKYTGLSNLIDDFNEDNLPVLFVGPRAAYIATKGEPKEINYPPTFSNTINREYLKQAKTVVVLSAFIGGFIVWLLIKFFESMAYVLLIIAPILLFKFRRMGLTYNEGVKVGLYLVSFQIVISSVLLLAGLAYIWIHLVFIALYVFFIGAYVNIDLSHSKRQLFKTGNPQ